MSGLVAVDDYTVEITIAEPNVTFLASLAYSVASVITSDSDVYPAAPDEGADLATRRRLQLHDAVA